MTWTYSGNPAASLKDEIRFLFGDTDTNLQQVQDEEITYALNTWPETPGATLKAHDKFIVCAMLADSLAGKYSPHVEKSIGRGFSLGDQAKFEHYQKLAAQFRKMARFGPTGIANAGQGPVVDSSAIPATDGSMSSEWGQVLRPGYP